LKLWVSLKLFSCQKVSKLQISRKDHLELINSQWYLKSQFQHTDITKHARVCGDSFSLTSCSTYFPYHLKAEMQLRTDSKMAVPRSAFCCRISKPQDISVPQFFHKSNRDMNIFALESCWGLNWNRDWCIEIAFYKV
jgi:hypothetical protein